MNAQAATLRPVAELAPADLLLGAEPSVGDLPCPHCRSETFRRSSRMVTATFREIFYICRNIGCGHSFKASLSYEYGLSPSAIPDPAVNLPMRPLDREATMAALRLHDPPVPDPNQPGLFD